ncbi:hypothetical protein ACGFT2_15015 [Streptomyces sp. NPDC048514]|uniref:hypothetical protein n=1 Tax=Streptomyces sp. NPDC048514 TaxID=3365564 RepID=UPI003721A806
MKQGSGMVDGASRVLLTASLVVPLLVLVLHRFGSSGSSREGSPLPRPRQDPLPSRPPPPHAGHSGRAGHSVHSGLTHILLGLGIVLPVEEIVIAGPRLWRYTTRRPAREAPVSYEALDDERERLTQAVDSGRRALLDGTDARAAVIACYATMEASLAVSGVARHASDRPQDLL